MIVFRYLNREVLRTFWGILLVLFLVAFSQRILHHLGALTSGDLSALALVQLLLLFLPLLISLLLPLTLFIAILMTLGRLYIEQEMNVLRASGVSERDVLRHLLKPVLLMSLLTAFITLLVQPWSMNKQSEVREQEAARAELNLLNPGRFQETSDGRSVIYVRDKASDNDLSGVLLITLPKTAEDATQFVAADSGSHWSNELDGSRYLVLQQGRRYEMQGAEANWNVTQFERYFVRTAAPSVAAGKRALRAQSSLELIKGGSIAQWAELQWRLSLPLSLPILALLAIPLCRVRPREGKFARVIPGLLVYVVYIGGLMSLRNAMEQQLWPLWLGVWPLHLAVAAAAWWLLGSEDRHYRRLAQRVKVEAQA